MTLPLPPVAVVNVLGVADYLVIALYLGFSVAIGWWVQRRKQTSGNDYFLGGGRVPMWAGAVSWYATAVSSVSFMALPAAAYGGNWLPMMVGPAGSVGGFIVAFAFVGILRRLNAPTIFIYLERRFSVRVRLIVAALAMILKIFGRASVIMVLPALALSAATGLNVYFSIVMMGLVTTAYSMKGGFAAVIWTDVLQVAVMFGGVIMMVWYAAAGVEGGLAGIVEIAAAADKFQFVSWDLSFSKVTGWVLLGFTLGSVFVIVSDQALVQRALAASDIRSARRTVLVGSILGFPSNAVFFFVGTALFAFYQANPERLAAGLPNDAIVGYFIAHELPRGIVGLIIAGIFAAAMSTLSSSVSAVAAIGASDFLSVLRPASHDAVRVTLGRTLTLFAGIFATAMALWVASLETASLWDKSVRLLALFGGPLPGIFALGMLTRRAHERGVIIGAVAGLATIIYIQNFTSITSFFHSFVAFIVTLVVGYLGSLGPRPAGARPHLDGLTIWDLTARAPARPAPTP